MSINQLFQAEKKIRCLSLLQKEALQRVAQLVVINNFPDEESCENSADNS